MLLQAHETLVEACPVSISMRARLKMPSRNDLRMTFRLEGCRDFLTLRFVRETRTDSSWL